MELPSRLVENRAVSLARPQASWKFTCLQ